MIQTTTRRVFLKSGAALSLASSLPSICKAAETVAGRDALEFFVSPTGSDENAGTRSRPFATLVRAQKAVRKSRNHGQPKTVIVSLSRGWYLQDTPLVFVPEDGGSAGAPVVYRSIDESMPGRGVPGQGAIITGGRRLTGTWFPVVGKTYWVLDVPQACNRQWAFNSLYINGMSRQVARKADPSQKPMTGTGPVPGEPKNGALYFKEGDLNTNWERKDDGYIVLTNTWTSTIHKIISIDNEKRVVKFVSSDPRAVDAFYKEFPYYVCNFLEILDEPGEWYLDQTAGKLYYCPFPDEDMGNLEVIAPILTTTLVEIAGKLGEPVPYLEFHNIAFRHTDWSMAKVNGIYRQGCTFLGSGVSARYMTHGVFKNCQFSQLGEYAMELADGCQHNEVSECHFWDVGGGAIMLGIADFGAQKKLEDSAPANDVRALNNIVDNCLLHRLGTVLPNVYCIVNRFASFSKITHNEVFDVHWCAIGSDARWAYHAGDDFCHGNEVAYNYLHHLGLGLIRDTAGYYQFGPLDTHVHHNLIHDTVGKEGEFGYNGIYLDEQSRGALVENNLVYRIDGLIFFQNDGVGNVFRNNIGAFALEGFFWRGTKKIENDFSLTRNLCLSAGKSIFPRPWKPVEKDPSVLDENVYWDTQDHRAANDDFLGKSFADWQKLGFDQHSTIADPLFRDAVNGDFTLLPTSPAPKRIGFVPFYDEMLKTGLYGEDAWRTLGQKMPRRPRPVLDFISVKPTQKTSA
jgi:hypothetical protein